MDKSEKDIKDRVDELYKILGGNIDGTAGLVNVVQDLVRDVYDAKRGLHVRLEKLENERLWLKGWLTCALVVGGLIGWILNYFK